MSTANIQVTTRQVGANISLIDIQGEVTGFAESALMDGYNAAVAEGAQALILNFSELEYMNSSGIGLLVTLLIRAQRQGKKLHAFGLNEHYKQIFELTRLNEAIQIYADEPSAMEGVAAHAR